MFKIISKREYESLHNIIAEQSDQVNRLIDLTTKAQRRAQDAEKCYLDLISLVADKLDSFSPETVEAIHEIVKQEKDQA